MKQNADISKLPSIEHLKFEVAQEYGLNQKSAKKTEKNIKNS